MSGGWIDGYRDEIVGMGRDGTVGQDGMGWDGMRWDGLGNDGWMGK